MRSAPFVASLLFYVLSSFFTYMAALDAGRYQ